MEDVVSQSHCNRLRRQVLEEIGIREREKCGVTGQCSVCHFFDAIKGTATMSADLREHARKLKADHMTFVKAELNVMHARVAQSITSPSEHLCLEMDGAAQHDHVLPHFGGGQKTLTFIV